MDFNKVIELAEPFRKKWRLSKRNIATGVNFQGKNKARNETHTLISLYNSDVDHPGSIEVAFKVEGIANLFGKTQSDIAGWIRYAEKEIGQYATPKTTFCYRRIALLNVEQFADFLKSFDEFLLGTTISLEKAVPNIKNTFVVDELIMSQIRTRRGQQEFREKLFEVYGYKCAFTGCTAKDALEAAHIIPHAEQQSYDLRNGLLLRADIHTLFDLYLLSINPESGNICIAESIKSSYSELDGKPVMLPSIEFLDPARLKIHHMKWAQKNDNEYLY
jgi:hypothetical protein